MIITHDTPAEDFPTLEITIKLYRNDNNQYLGEFKELFTPKNKQELDFKIQEMGSHVVRSYKDYTLYDAEILLIKSMKIYQEEVDTNEHSKYSGDTL